jgi:hypothetical protein
MKDSFGELLIKKGTTLYCSSCFTIDEIINNPEKVPILYYVFFHQPEYEMFLNTYKLILKKDISLFFDIKFNIDININNNNENIFKDIFPCYDSVLRSIIKNTQMNELLYNKLKQNNFDGFFGNRLYHTIVSITLFNNIELFDIHIDNYELKQIYDDEMKTYYKSFPLNFLENKFILNINKKYCKSIKKYISIINKYAINSDKYYNLNFYYIIQNSEINYHNDEEKDILFLLNN